MKKYTPFLLVLIIGTIFSYVAPVFSTPAPFIPEVYNRFIADEARITNTEADIVSLEAYETVSADSSAISKKYFKLTFEPTVANATGSATASAIIIPASSSITNVYAFVEEQLAATGTQSITLGCETDTDLFNVDLSASATSSITSGTPTGAAATYVVTDGCTLQIGIGSATPSITNGKIKLIGEYQSIY